MEIHLDRMPVASIPEMHCWYRETGGYPGLPERDDPNTLTVRQQHFIKYQGFYYILEAILSLYICYTLFYILVLWMEVLSTGTIEGKVGTAGKAGNVFAMVLLQAMAVCVSIMCAIVIYEQNKIRVKKARIDAALKQRKVD
jgi:hypothetical protein